MKKNKREYVDVWELHSKEPITATLVTTLEREGREILRVEKHKVIYRPKS